MLSLSKQARTGAGRLALRMTVLASLAVTLAGCYSTKSTLSDDVPNDYRKRHPITVREGEQKMEIFVGSHRGGLSASQRADVLSFAHAWRRDSTGGIAIDLPTGTSNAAAAAESLREIRSLLSAAGVLPRGIDVQPYQPGDMARLAVIKLRYPRMVAQAGPCGLWPNDLGPGGGSEYLQNRTYYNFGCANQRNLAAMVENPADLVQPRGEAAVYGPRRNTVMDKYRKGETTAGSYPSIEQAKISDVGK